jgi:hypothetical protein
MGGLGRFAFALSVHAVELVMNGGAPGLLSWELTRALRGCTTGGIAFGVGVENISWEMGYVRCSVVSTYSIGT